MTNVDPMIGRLIGEKYRVIDYIGGGGFGAVYRAEQEPVGRVVALKVIKKSDKDEEELRARFLREARSAARLKSPHIVTLFDYGEEPDGTLYMVFEFVEGRTLKSILVERTVLPVDQAAQYAVHILEGLSVAHNAGIIHRDLKPANIMISKGAWGYEEARVLDFGVAKMLEVDGNDPLQASTRRGLVLGTPHYMSPEQARTLRVDARADVYAMGTLLYVMIAGRPPFTGETTFAILQAHVQQPPDGPVGNLEIAEGVKAVLLRALQKKPEDRYQSAREMAAALAPFARTPLEESANETQDQSDSQVLASLAPDTAFAAQSRDSQVDIDHPAPTGSSPWPIALTIVGLIAAGLAWFWLTGAPPQPISDPVKDATAITTPLDASRPVVPDVDQAPARPDALPERAPSVDAQVVDAPTPADASVRKPKAQDKRRKRIKRPPPPRKVPTDSQKPERKKKTSTDSIQMEQF